MKRLSQIRLKQFAPFKLQHTKQFFFYINKNLELFKATFVSNNKYKQFGAVRKLEITFKTINPRVCFHFNLPCKFMKYKFGLTSRII